jgi:hypothetical protein
MVMEIWIMQFLKDDSDLTLLTFQHQTLIKGVTNTAGSNYVVDYELTKPSYEDPFTQDG